MAVATNMRKGGTDDDPRFGQAVVDRRLSVGCAVHRAGGRELGSRRLWNATGGFS
jgi:hypothetical protein